ncbi:MAG: helix-turn-helix domain-containing protein [Pigmentiphaga sp.]
MLWHQAAGLQFVLQFLMEQHGLKQSDLSEVGSQSVVSQILSGRRMLNARQVAALAARFGVGADVFLEIPDNHFPH